MIRYQLSCILVIGSPAASPAPPSQPFYHRLSLAPARKRHSWLTQTCEWTRVWTWAKPCVQACAQHTHTHARRPRAPSPCTASAGRTSPRPASPCDTEAAHAPRHSHSQRTAGHTPVRTRVRMAMRISMCMESSPRDGPSGCNLCIRCRLTCRDCRGIEIPSPAAKSPIISRGSGRTGRACSARRAGMVRRLLEIQRLAGILLKFP